MHDRAGRSAARGDARRIDRPLAWFGGAVIVLSAAGVALGAALLHHPRSTDPETVAVSVGGIKAELPGAWVRSRSGEDVALALTLGDLGVAPATAAEGKAPILVHLTPADDTSDPGERPATLYARFLSPQASAGSGNLVRREFRAGTPYEGETLYLTPPDGRAFAARCTDATPVGQAECSAAFRVKGAEVRLGLPLTLLAHGPAIARRLIQRLGGA